MSNSLDQLLDTEKKMIRENKLQLFNNDLIVTLNKSSVPSSSSSSSLCYTHTNNIF